MQDAQDVLQKLAYTIPLIIDNGIVLPGCSRSMHRGDNTPLTPSRGLPKTEPSADKHFRQHHIESGTTVQTQQLETRIVRI